MFPQKSYYFSLDSKVIWCRPHAEHFVMKSIDVADGKVEDVLYCRVEIWSAIQRYVLRSFTMQRRQFNDMQHYCVRPLK